MARRSSPITVQQWMDRFQRFSESGQTVARFCAAEGVSVPSFYNWKKKLGLQAGLFDSARPSRPAKQSGSLRPGSERKAFQAIELIPSAPGTVTIRLPNGIVIEVAGDINTTDRLFARSLQSPVDSARGWSC